MGERGENEGNQCPGSPRGWRAYGRLTAPKKLNGGHRGPQKKKKPSSALAESSNEPGGSKLSYVGEFALKTLLKEEGKRLKGTTQGCSLIALYADGSGRGIYARGNKTVRPLLLVTPNSKRRPTLLRQKTGCWSQKNQTCMGVVQPPR